MRKKIITQNKEIYEKLNLLNITNEIVLTQDKIVQRILNNINKDGIFLEGVKISDKLILIKKKKPIRLDVYLQ
jgi:hypothetical protein